MIDFKIEIENIEDELAENKKKVLKTFSKACNNGTYQRDTGSN